MSAWLNSPIANDNTAHTGGEWGKMQESNVLQWGCMPGHAEDVC